MREYSPTNHCLEKWLQNAETPVEIQRVALVARNLPKSAYLRSIQNLAHYRSFTELSQTLEPLELLLIIEFDVFINWYDEYATSGDLFGTTQVGIVKNSEHRTWINKHPTEFKRAMEQLRKYRTGLGFALLAAEYGLSQHIDVITKSFLEIDEVAYNGEGATDSVDEDISYYRELGKIALAIERLANKPINKAIRLSKTQRKALLKRKVAGETAANAVLKSLEP